MQARKRGFPKGYEKILESYYKRLADKAKDQTASPKKAGAKPMKKTATRSKSAAKTPKK